MTETINTTRSWGTTQPDKHYSVGHVDSQFDVPLGVSWEMMKVLAYPVVKQTIEQFEKIGKWQHYDKLEVEYHVANIQSRGMNKGATSIPGIIESSDEVTMIARIYFIRPLTFVNMDEEREWKEFLNSNKAYDEGYVKLDDMPKEFKEYREQHPL